MMVAAGREFIFARARVSSCSRNTQQKRMSVFEPHHTHHPISLLGHHIRFHWLDRHRKYGTDAREPAEQNRIQQRRARSRPLGRAPGSDALRHHREVGGAPARRGVPARNRLEAVAREAAARVLAARDVVERVAVLVDPPAGSIAESTPPQA